MKNFYYCTIVVYFKSYDYKKMSKNIFLYVCCKMMKTLLMKTNDPKHVNGLLGNYELQRLSQTEATLKLIFVKVRYFLLLYFMTSGCSPSI